MHCGVYNSYLEVDLRIIKENIEKIYAGIDDNQKIMAVLKGNAYGAGLIEIAEYITKECGINAIACAQVMEAVKMRDAAINVPILIMGGVPYHNIPAVIENDLSTPAYHKEYLELLNQEARLQHKQAKVHIKIETGLNRIGVKPGQPLEDLCRYLKELTNITVVGIYTHFSEADEIDKSVTYLEMDRFTKGLAQAKQYFQFEYIHVFNTAASTWLKDPSTNFIRPAALLFGLDTNIEPVNLFHVRECMSWHAFITHIKEVGPNETIGYNRCFITSRKCKIATISIGFGDGYPRFYVTSQKAEAIIHGSRVPLIATCMDQSFLDVTNCDVKVNDKVTVLGRNGEDFISPFEIQERTGESYLTMLCTISDRVKRLYLR